MTDTVTEYDDETYEVSLKDMIAEVEELRATVRALTEQVVAAQAEATA